MGSLNVTDLRSFITAWNSMVDVRNATGRKEPLREKVKRWNLAVEVN
jgi:hypothetical protein